MLLWIFKFQSTKGEKGSVSAGQVEANMEELSGDDSFGNFHKYICYYVNYFPHWKAGFLFFGGGECDS